MRQRLLKHAGLARPYQFERTLVVVASLAFSAVVVVIALYLHARGQLPTGTPRAWYVAYLIALAALALALAPLPRMAAVVLSLATLEAGFGFGALALYKYHVIPSPTLTPSADDGRSTRFAWHPLLQVLPAASQNSPLTRINSARRRGGAWSAQEPRRNV